MTDPAINERALRCAGVLEQTAWNHPTTGAVSVSERREPPCGWTGASVTGSCPRCGGVLAEPSP